MTAIPFQTFSVGPRRIFWSCLLLITLAELITAVLQPYAGLLLHALIMLGLLAYAAFAPTNAARHFALALVLAPLIRLLSLSLPLLSFPQIMWYPLVSVPLLLTTWLMIRHTRIAAGTLGLCIGGWGAQSGIACIGLGLGVIEYAILEPHVLITSLSLSALWWPALSLLIFTGFTEELIFRGLLQPLALETLGRPALVFVSLLFAVLHVGYLSLSDVVFVFAVGLLFAYLVRWSGSIVGVTLAHGLTNMLLLLVLPYMAQHPDHPAAGPLSWLVGGGTIVGVATVAILALGARRPPPIIELRESPSMTLRALRRSYGLSYTEFAQLTGVSTRELAGIEHGIRSVEPERLRALVEQVERLAGAGRNDARR